MKKILTLIIVLLLAEIGYAQDPDPGVRDTVRFGDWGVYLPCPPCSGIATVPIFGFNDEFLIGITLRVETTGPIRIISAEFTTAIDSYFTNQYILIPSSGLSAKVNLTGGPYTYYPYPPNQRMLGYLLLSVVDSGVARLDTVRDELPEGCWPLCFEDTVGNWIRPIFISTPFQLVAQNIKPGDMNGDDGVNLSDIIYLVNYLFKSGAEPINKQMADVNVDCGLDLGDLIYLVHYIFKGGAQPLPGCAEVSSEKARRPTLSSTWDLIQIYICLPA